MSQPGTTASHSTNGKKLSKWGLREYYTTLYHQLASRMPELKDGFGTLGVTSCSRSCGVSTTAACIARAAVEFGERRTLLIDANFANPSVVKRFGLKVGPGLSELLLGQVEPIDAVHHSVVAGLDVIAAGAALDFPPNPEALNRCLDALRGHYQFVVLDLPPLQEPSLAAPLAGVLHGILVVVESARLPRAVGQRAKRQLNQVGANLLGIVVNKT